MGSHTLARRYMYGSIDKIHGALSTQYHHRRVYLGASDPHYCKTTDAAETKDHCVWHIRDRRVVSYSICCPEKLC